MRTNHSPIGRNGVNGTVSEALPFFTKENMTEIKEHMEVIGADGVHVGTVDKIEGNRNDQEG
jgi:hypothetical protein